MLIRRYKAVVAEGRLLVFLSVLFAILVRVLYFFSSQFAPAATTAIGYFAEPVTAFFDSNKLISVIASGISISVLALIVSLINSRYTLIRTKTLLPVLFISLLFSFHMQFFTMSVEYVSALLILLAISSLFAAYENSSKQAVAFNASFALAAGSFLDISLLAYIPLVWLVLPIVRSFSFKAILASLSSIALLYFPIFSYYLLTNQIELFTAPFELITAGKLCQFPFEKLELTHWSIIGLSVLLFIVIFINNYMTSYKDKIKTRSYNTILAIFIAFSLLAYLFININPITFKYGGLAVSALILGHFYAVVEEKWKIVSFVFYLLLFFIFCFINLQPIL